MREYRSKALNRGAIIEDQTVIVMPNHLFLYVWEHCDPAGRTALIKTYGQSNVTAVLKKAQLQVDARREEMKLSRKKAGRPRSLR